MPARPVPRRCPVIRTRGASARAPNNGPGASRSPDLARLLPLWPHEIADTSPDGRARLISRLERALRAERQRGIAGHWTYDLARHVALLNAYRAEVAAARLVSNALERTIRTREPTISRAAYRGPSSSRGRSERARNSGLPSGNHGEGPTSPGIPQE